MKASELHVARPWIQTLVYGDSGTGKTSWGARAPAPYMLVTEAQAVPSIAVANPDAEVELVDSYPALLETLAAMYQGATVEEDRQPWLLFEKDGKRYQIQTVILDSLTNIHSKIAEWKKVDEIEKKSLQRWSQTQTELKRLLDKLRTLPVNIVCTALQTTIGGGEDEPRRVVPTLHGKIAETVGQYFAAVGYSYKRNREYRISWTLGEGYITKRPATTETFPDCIVQDISTPGKTTLGSMLLHLYPGMVVAAEAHDDASFMQ